MKFTKMHGIGNDYIYFDCLGGESIRDPGGVAPRLADRHFGIGGDGIVLILPHDTADFRMRMFNPDGSESEMCGNAIRCVGKYVYDRGYTRSGRITVQTGAGILELELVIEDGIATGARVDMGEPVLNGPDIPVRIQRNPVVNEEILVEGRSFRMTCVSMGNPHCVIFVDEITDELVLGVGPELENHPLFPRRVNVEFVQVVGKAEAVMRVWERGAGETLACGTGASAVAVACVLNDLTEREVTVRLAGGNLELEWREDDDHVYMTGPAEHVFDGEVEIQ